MLLPDPLHLHNKNFPILSSTMQIENNASVFLQVTIQLIIDIGEIPYLLFTLKQIIQELNENVFISFLPKQMPKPPIGKGIYITTNPRNIDRESLFFLPRLPRSILQCIFRLYPFR